MGNCICFGKRERAMKVKGTSALPADRVRLLLGAARPVSHQPGETGDGRLSLKFLADPVSRVALVLEEGNAACQSGNFPMAVSIYTEALRMDPTSHVALSNRSAALVKMGRFADALQDAVRARQLKINWPKAYYRQGVALQCLGCHGDALAAFSTGLVLDPESALLLAGLVETSMKSPLRATLRPAFAELEAMDLGKSPFAIITMVGQELLLFGQHAAAVVVLDSAMRIGQHSVELRESLLSRLFSAYCGVLSLDKAICSMQHDLTVARSKGDIAGECRAHGNLGSAYFSKGSYKEALTSHRHQLVLATKCKDTYAAATALTSLGHAYTAIEDYPNALASHKQCVQMVKQTGDRLQEAREISNMGVAYLAMGKFESALDCHKQQLRLAMQLRNQVQETKSYSNLGSSHHFRRNFTQAIAFHYSMLRMANELEDRPGVICAYAGLGHAARDAGDYAQAVKYHKEELTVCKEFDNSSLEATAHGNLAVVYQALGAHMMALHHFNAHLSTVRKLEDAAGETVALLNLKNYLSTRSEFGQAVPSQENSIGHSQGPAFSTIGDCYNALGDFENSVKYHEQNPAVDLKLKTSQGKEKAHQGLSDSHKCLGNRQQALVCFEERLVVTHDLNKPEAKASEYGELSHNNSMLSNYEQAISCPDHQLAIARSSSGGNNNKPANEDSSKVLLTIVLPSLLENLLTATNLLGLQLPAPLVVVSSSLTQDQHGWATADGVEGLKRGLLQGSRVIKVLAEGMLTVQHTKHFAHLANWAGCLMVEADDGLTYKVGLMGQALCELLKSPEKCCDALLGTLHLVERSQQSYQGAGGGDADRATYKKRCTSGQLGAVFAGKSRRQTLQKGCAHGTSTMRAAQFAREVPRCAPSYPVPRGKVSAVDPPRTEERHVHNVEKHRGKGCVHGTSTMRAAQVAREVPRRAPSYTVPRGQVCAEDPPRTDERYVHNVEKNQEKGVSPSPATNSPRDPSYGETQAERTTHPPTKTAQKSRRRWSSPPCRSSN